MLELEMTRKRIGNYTIKYPIDENYFKKIDTAEKAYWLGFLYADGGMSATSNTILISLANKDISQLIKLRKSIQPAKPVRTFELNGRLYCSLAITNKLIKHDLIKHGCMPN